MTDETKPKARRKRATPVPTEDPGRSTPAAETASTIEANPAAGGDHPEDHDGREPGEIVIAMSPRQILGGFALLAGLILMVRRRRRDKD